MASKAELLSLFRKSKPSTAAVAPGKPCVPCAARKVAAVEKRLVSLVIPARDEGAWIGKTVQSALNAATGPFEVIVVDDGSTDGSCDDLARDDGSVRVIRNAQPEGAGMARHIGLSAARGAVVATSDAHCAFEGGMWHELAAWAVEHQCIVCPGINAMYGGLMGRGARLCWHRDYKIGQNYGKVDPAATEPQLVTGILGSVYLMPREIFDRMNRWPSTAALWGYEEQPVGVWAYFHDVPIYASPKYAIRHLYYSEREDRKNPWGAPTVSQMWLNIATAHMALFEPRTWMAIWRKPAKKYLSKADRVTMVEYERGHKALPNWREDKKHTDYEFFRDILRVPPVQGPGGSVTGLRPISVVVLTRDDGPEFHNTLLSVTNSAHTPFEIIAVDDASKDGAAVKKVVAELPEKVYKHWRPGLAKRLRLIRHPVPEGCSKSRAHAIREAKGEIYAIFDGHQRVITPFGIETMAAQAQDTGGIIVGACCNLGKSTGEARTWGAQMIVKPKWGLFNKHLTEKPEERLARRTAIIGAGYVLTKETLDALGGWPELPGPWAYNEQWLGIRAYFLDVPMFCDTNVTVEHAYNLGNRNPVPLPTTLHNAHLTHYVHFGDEAYNGFFRPCLKEHGWCASINGLLVTDETQKMRADFQAQKKHSDQDFFREVLGITDWPPRWPESNNGR